MNMINRQHWIQIGSSFESCYMKDHCGILSSLNYHEFSMLMLLFKLIQ